MGEIILRVAVEVKVKRDFSSVFFALNAPLRQYVKYIEVILQPQQTLFFCCNFKYSVFYDIYRPTWPFSGNTQYIRNTLD